MQAFHDKVAVFRVGRGIFGEYVVMPKGVLQHNQFIFVVHVAVKMSDDRFVFRIAVETAKVSAVNVHNRHVVPRLRFVVDGNDLLPVVPPVVPRVVVGRFYL